MYLGHILHGGWDAKPVVCECHSKMLFRYSQQFALLFSIYSLSKKL